MRTQTTSSCDSVSCSSLLARSRRARTTPRRGFTCAAGPERAWWTMRGPEPCASTGVARARVDTGTTPPRTQHCAPSSRHPASREKCYFRHHLLPDESRPERQVARAWVRKRYKGGEAARGRGVHKARGEARPVPHVHGTRYGSPESISTDKLHLSVLGSRPTREPSVLCSPLYPQARGCGVCADHAVGSGGMGGVPCCVRLLGWRHPRGGACRCQGMCHRLGGGRTPRPVMPPLRPPRAAHTEYRFLAGRARRDPHSRP